jgi:hypothetical protein
MKTRRILAGVVGATMALALAGAVFATDVTALNQTGTAIDGTTYKQVCTVPEGVTPPGPGEVLWHFIWTGPGTSVTGHFAFSDGELVQDSVTQGGIESWWIITDANVTLDGSNTYVEATGGEFTLSHTCFNPGETPSPSPSPSPSASPTETPNVTPSPTPTLPENTPSPTLPQTNTIDQSNGSGPGASLTLVFALILAIAGGLTAYAMRPRRVGNR